MTTAPALTVSLSCEVPWSAITVDPEHRPLVDSLPPDAYKRLSDEQRRVLATLDCLSRGEQIAWLIDLIHAARTAELDETAFVRHVIDLREAKVLDFVVAHVNRAALILGPWATRKRMHAAVVDLVRRAQAA